MSSAASASAPVTLILGVDHNGLGGPFALSNRPWETPLGRVDVDHGLVEALRQPPLEIDEDAHAPEHSIEVELPFLQYVEPYPTIVPLMVRYAPFETLRRVAPGRSFRDRGARRPLDRVDGLLPLCLRRDRSAARPVWRSTGSLRGTPKGLYETVRDQGISMCGIAPTTVLLEILREEALDVPAARHGATPGRPNR